MYVKVCVQMVMVLLPLVRLYGYKFLILLHDAQCEFSSKS